ncbi:nms-17 [Pelobates cultripes]|uniref:Neuromedin-S n=1 Tax=Pelobates cultripes TaxID=61616 RepID=A0AAD1VKV2_PELCU|nr:nms-17 [Pelobates cultripes]
MIKSWKHNRAMSITDRRTQMLSSAKHHHPLPLMFAICCLSALQLSSGFPQALPHYVESLDIPESERLAFCFSQWIALSDQPEISSFIMDLCSSIYNRMKVDEENNQEIYKRFLFHYSRAKDPALKAGESQITTEEFTKKDSSGTLGRPFFLFRPRNGRKVSINEH